MTHITGGVGLSQPIVQHVAQAHMMQLGFVERQHTVEPSLQTDPIASLEWAQKAITTELAGPERATRTIEGVGGETTFADSIDNFLSFDLLIHRWDLARAASLEASFDVADVRWARRVADGFGVFLRTEGVCGPASISCWLPRPPHGACYSALVELRVAAYAVIIDDAGRMLLPHWQSPGPVGGWTLPGGGLDPGEDPFDAVVREVFEETGYRAAVDELLGIDNHVIPGERRLSTRKQGIALHALRIVYRAHIIGGELTAEQDGSTDDVDWFTRDQIEQLERVGLVDVGRRLAGLLDS